MKKKLLVTGFGGFVAGSVVDQALDIWEVHAVGRRDIPGKPGGVYFHHLDLLENDKLTDLYQSINPDAVIHAAAKAGIDFCERNREAAEKVNAGVTGALAELCEGNGAKLVFCSTDTVFDGQRGMYTEADVPNPVNFYAETKIRAEELVSTAGHAVIARLSLVIGLPVMGFGNSFLAKVIRNLEDGNQIKLPSNEIRTPIDVITLGSALVELAGNDFDGIIHLSGNTRLTRYEMGLTIAEKLNFPKTSFVAIDSGSLEGRAPRPNDVSLDNHLAKTVLNTPMRSLLEGLEVTLNYNVKTANQKQARQKN